MTRPAAYTIRETLDNGRAYDCNMCPHASPDLDAARAHYAVHVAGPDTLTALKGVVALSDRKHDAWDKAHAAIAKAEPKG
ncbi:MAG: hypothetical protein PHS14_00400 [Elusimicrobia bacterium]|nr:hypothetical protein [Elusimicrobiota bacterium]